MLNGLIAKKPKAGGGEPDAAGLIRYTGTILEAARQPWGDLAGKEAGRLLKDPAGAAALLRKVADDWPAVPVPVLFTAALLLFFRFVECAKDPNNKPATNAPVEVEKAAT